MKNFKYTDLEYFETEYNAVIITGSFKLKVIPTRIYDGNVSDHCNYFCHFNRCIISISNVVGLGNVSALQDGQT